MLKDERTNEVCFASPDTSKFLATELSEQALTLTNLVAKDNSDRLTLGKRNRDELSTYFSEKHTR